MNAIRSLLGRRQFLIALVGSVFMPTYRRAAKLFGIPLSERSALASTSPSTSAGRPLKACVIYYSATGSTGKVAGAIHRGMKSVMACDVAPIKKMDPKAMAQYDVIAVGGPVWYFRETANLRLFVYDMPPMDGKLCVPFCTHGTNPDGFFYSLSSQILKKGLEIIGWNDWYGGCSHVLHQPSPYFTDGHPDEIDLKEAEAFGREMAERAQRIYDGEKSLVPEIPSGPDADSLWVPFGFDSEAAMPVMAPADGMPPGTVGMGGDSGPGGRMSGAGQAETGGPSGGMPGGAMPEGGMPPGGGMPGGSGGGAPRAMPGNADAATMTPAIDLAKCIYPRCTACMDNCLVDAIDLSLSVQESQVSGSKFLVKEACLHCSHPLCEKSCDYNAITFDNGVKTEHVFDMKKCTYPKCTLCVDECPMGSIDFSKNPPYVRRNCEGCDLCWCVCPEDAIGIPNLATTHALLQPSGPNDAFFADLNEAEKTGRFRRLVPLEEIGWDTIVMNKPNAPRVVLKPENYPYEIEG